MAAPACDALFDNIIDAVIYCGCSDLFI